MINVELDLVAANEAALDNYDFVEYLDEDDDGVICFADIHNANELDMLINDDAIEIRIVYINNEYKHLFVDFETNPSADCGFAVELDDSNMDSIMAIVKNN